MLEYSILFSKLIFSKFNNSLEYFVCYNNLGHQSRKKLLGIFDKHDINSIDVSDDLHPRLRNPKVKNSWWKYAIPRIDKTSYEILMDNDIILWSIPPTLKKAINSNSLVALEDGVGKFYGDFLESVNILDINLNLNAGLLGCPPGFEIKIIEIVDTLIRDFFFSEQGYTALQYAKYNGSKLLIPHSEIQQLNANRISALDLINCYNGGHFCGCSYDIETFWTKIYSTSVKEKYKEMI